MGIVVYNIFPSPNATPVEIHVGSIHTCNCLDCRFKGFDELKHLNASNTYSIHIEAKSNGVLPREQVRIVQKKDGVWGIAYFEEMI